MSRFRLDMKKHKKNIERTYLEIRNVKLRSRLFSGNMLKNIKMNLSE